MIDNITAHFENRKIIQNKIIDHPKFDINANFKYSNGEILSRYANIHNLRIRDTKTFTELKGSLHTYWNLINGFGKQNWSDFSYKQILETIEMFEELFHCHAREIKLTNFEFGFNLQTIINPSDYLLNSIIFYKYLLPCEDHKNEKNMKLLKFIYENYIHKLYDKSKEYSLSENILRMEIVYRTKALFKNFSIMTLDDLQNKDCYYKMFKDYLKRFDKDFIIVDSFNGTANIPVKDRITLVQYTNSAFWLDLKNTNTNYYDTKMYKDNFLELVVQYGLDSKKNYLKGLLIEKFETLFNS